MFDVVILGGGLVGPSLACALEKQGLQVALVDNRPIGSSISVTPRARALALSLTSVNLLKQLQVWEILKSNAYPIKSVHVSKKGHFGSTRLEANVQQERLGMVVNADVLRCALHQRLVEMQDLSLFCPDQIKNLSKNANSIQITLSSGVSLNTRLLVGADGTDSYVREFWGISTEVIDSKQSAILTNVQLNQDHQDCAFERFLSDGSIALLPFGHRQMKCVRVFSSTEAELAMSLTNEQYLVMLQQQFGYRLGIFGSMDERYEYPLKTVRAANLYDDKVVLIGNAANTLHPIAAQGFNLGLRDAMTLSIHIPDALQSIVGLQRYAAERKKDHDNTNLFSQTLAKPSIFHSLGIAACEWLPWVKSKVVQQGLGIQ